MTTISLKNLGKSFGGTAAVRDVSLDLVSGSFTALLGPSGCGKTTLLRLIAGFEQPTTGEVLFDHALVADPNDMVAPEKRGLGIVFQSYALWPLMDVAGNVAYPLKGRGLGGKQIERRVAEALDMVSLGGFGRRGVDALSGGQRQRVALARCLVTGTRIILLDEPLANLDVHLRAAMLEVFAEIHRCTGATIVFVTHDQAEALALADRIVVLDSGRVQQIGTPQQIYAEPANAMVAGFVGRGTLVEGLVEDGAARIGEVRIRARGVGQGRVKLLVRPQSVSLVESGLPAGVERVSFAGAHYETIFAIPGSGRIVAHLPHRLDIGTPVHLGIDDAWIVPG